MGTTITQMEFLFLDSLFESNLNSTRSPYLINCSTLLRYENEHGI